MSELNVNHYNVPLYRQRVTKKEAQDILLNHDTVICHGRVYLLKCISVGAGIYEIFKDLKRYEEENKYEKKYDSYDEFGNKLGRDSNCKEPKQYGECIESPTNERELSIWRRAIAEGKQQAISILEVMEKELLKLTVVDAQVLEYKETVRGTISEAITRIKEGK